MRRGFIAVALTLLAGCASNPVSVADDGSRWRWWRIGDGARFGPENSEASEALQCRATERTIDLVFFDPDEFAGFRPMTLKVHMTEFAGSEALDPLDGGPTSRVAIPLDHPILSAVAAGARAIVVENATGRHEWPGGPIPAQMVRDCLKAARNKAG